MKLLELDLSVVKEYLRQDGDEDDRLIQAIIEASKSYVCNYTGQSIDQLEEYEDVTIAVLVLIAEFYEKIYYVCIARATANFIKINRM